jgi:integrase
MPDKTKNAKGGGTIRKRPDGRWEARFTVGRDSGTGKQIQRSVYGKTQAEVRKKLQAACVAIDERTYTDPVKFTVGDWLNVWLSEYTPNLKPHTRKSYEGHVNNHIKPIIGAVRLSAINTHQIQMLYNQLIKGGGKAPGLSPKTLKNLHGVLHKSLQQAVEMGYIKYNPSNACRIPRIEKPEIKPLEDNEVAIFLKAIKGHKYETLYTVDLFTGMRQGEILGLTWDCVDFQSGTIQIYRQLQKIKGEYMFVSLKNDKRRSITPAASIMRVLQDYKRVQNEWRLKAGAIWENSGLVFTNEIGGHLAHFTVYKNFKRIVKSIGLQEARFHDLRHSYAVAALQAGDDIKTVQENLGHHSASFTLDVYGHVSERMKQESAARMERFIKSVSE